MASVSKRAHTRADGSNGDKWIVRYVDGQGTHRQKSFDRKKEADAYRQKVERDTAAGVLAPQADKMTIRGAANAFLDRMQEREREGQIGGTHLRTVMRHVELHIAPYIGQITLSAANLPTLTTWYTTMRAARPIGHITAKAICGTLKMVFDFAMECEWIHRNPADLLLKKLRGLKTEPVKTFTVDEVKHLLTVAGQARYQGMHRKGHLMTQTAVHLAAFCGLRIGEIFALHIENIDFAASVVRIRHSVSKIDGLKAPKSKAGIRDVAMPAHVAALLAAWIERYAEGRTSGLMFKSPRGGFCDQSSFRSGNWGTLLRRAGFCTDRNKPSHHFHALRHFATSWMIDAGWSLPDVAVTMGHAKVDVTMRVYAHALQKRGASPNEMQALSDRLLPAPPLALAR